MPDHQQRAPRKNLFLAASIEAGSLKAQVRIRNMSESGVMIEGPLLPASGSTLIIRRGELEIGGTIAWLDGGRCGIRFDGVAQLDEWVAGKRLSARGNALSGQSRVDTIQAAIRLGQPREIFDEEGDPATDSEAKPAVENLHHRIGQEIAAMQRILVATADELSDDPLMLSRHISQLQALQAASEILDHLARVLQAPDEQIAAANITLRALRARLLGKSLF